MGERTNNGRKKKRWERKWRQKTGEQKKKKKITNNPALSEK